MFLHLVASHNLGRRTFGPDRFDLAARETERARPFALCELGLGLRELGGEIVQLGRCVRARLRTATCAISPSTIVPGPGRAAANPR